MSNAFGTQTNVEAGKSRSLRLHITLLALGKICREARFCMGTQISDQNLP